MGGDTPPGNDLRSRNFGRIKALEITHAMMTMFMQTILPSFCWRFVTESEESRNLKSKAQNQKEKEKKEKGGWRVLTEDKTKRQNDIGRKQDSG